ncbi:hypothetical protein [Desulfotruncus arcticus]|nr:hypothetical protein [Desulfotruncus arcticus]
MRGELRMTGARKALFAAHAVALSGQGLYMVRPGTVSLDPDWPPDGK